MKIILVFTKIGTLSLVFLVCLLCLQSDGADIGGNCTVDVNCTNSNGACVDSKCGCVDKICQLKIDVNKTCNSTGSAHQCKDPMSSCIDVSGTYRCTCNTGYYNNNGTCANKKLPGGSCTTVGTTTECLDSNSKCTAETGGGNKCRCTAGYYDNYLNDTNVGGTCTPKIDVNKTCNSTRSANQCKDPMSSCIDVSGTYRCTCNTGYYNNKGTCANKKLPGGSCTTVGTTTECLDSNSKCTAETGGGNKCRCTAGYYDNYLNDTNVGGTCTPKIDVNKTCNSTRSAHQCKDPMSSCIDVSGTYRCTCNTGYYNNKGTCANKKLPGGSCTTVGTTTECLDSNSKCTAETGGGNKCRCTAGYYDNYLNDTNVGGTCTPKIDVNKTCNSTRSAHQCKDPMSSCIDVSGTYRCTCNTGYYNNKGTCANKKLPGGSCTTVGTTTECLDSNSKCTAETGGGNKCRCTAGYYDNYLNDTNVGGTCTPKIDVNKTCNSTRSAHQCKDPMSSCIDVSGTYRCTCNTGYYNNKGTCANKKLPGGSCTTVGTTTECLDSNSKCTAETGGGNKCRCTAGYYDNYLNDTNVGGTCTPKIDVNKTCNSTGSANQCKDPMSSCIDVSGTYRCTCNTGYYNNKGTCANKKLPGGSCTTVGTTTECLDSNSTCTTEDGGGNKCRCTAGYYDSDLNGTNVGGTCTPKKQLGGSCTMQGKATECLDSNSTCTAESGGGNKCRCTALYYDNNLSNSNVGGTCVLKSALGEVCINGQTPNQCSVKKSECIPATTGSSDYTCICMASYYRDGQECKLLTELKVQNLNVPDVTTGETFFVVTWTNPSTVNFIDKYQLILAFNGQNESSLDINKTNTITEYNISSRVPGRTYTIILSSVETQTRPTQQTTDVVITDGTRPAIPGAITQSVFNGPTISISWNITGDLEYLSGIINDTTASPSTFNKTLQQLPSLSITNLTNGDKYTFTVTAHSNGFSSAAYTQTIRTTPTRPPPPTEFACDDTNIYDRYMILTWKEPATPNGYIQHYIIYIMFRNMQITTNGSVLEQKVDGLTPEQDYYFNITTVNDATNGESSHSNQIICPTRAGLSTPPQNVTTAVTSNKITVHWDYPIDPAGVLWGYRIHVKNETDDPCVQEIIFQCVNGCSGVMNLNYTYNCIKNITLNTNSTQMNQTMSYDIEDLLPYVNYEVTIQAVNAAGSGHPKDIIRRTSQEIPKKPLQVIGDAQSDPKTLQVTWQQPLPRPGITNYTVKVYEENDQKTMFVYKEGFKKEISGYYTQTATIDGLEEYWNYTFVIVATTSIGYVESDMSPAVMTRHSAPGNVVNFTIDNPSEIYNQMNVMWSIPLIRERNSVIMKYVISHNISGNMESQDVLDNAEVSFMKTFNVTAEQSYEVEVYAVNTHNQNGSIINETYYAEPGPPKPPPVDAVVESTSAPTTTQTTIKLKFELSWFLNTDNGVRTDGGVMVCQASKCTGYGAKNQAKEGSYFQDLSTWKKSKLGGFEKPYRVTNISWVDDISATSGRRKRSNNEVELIIGEDVLCDKQDVTVFCNGPLPAGTSFIVVAFACTNGGCTESPHFGPYFTQAIPVDPPGSLIGIIAGAVAAVVVVIIVIIAVFVKRRRNRQKPMEKDWDNPIGLETPSVARKNIKLNKPIVMEDFERVVEDLHKDANLKFAHEYEELKTLTDPKTLKGVTTNLAETEENKLKNRYVNILPYDKTIVKLLPLADDDENATTFINANYIPGYHSQREYIASQGPIPSTIDDFWRMIWEQNVAIVVMLTLCKEQGRIKCECYWPTEVHDPKQYRDIVVELTSFSTLNTYEIRVFKLTMGDTTHYVKHFHFLNWKDFSANVQNDVMIDFIHNVRSHVRIPESKVPMIVHCSAGVGRTGTYITLDHWMQFIHDHDFSNSIDIFKTVVEMRKCRMYMVQTEQQYIFIYDCIRDILKKKRLFLREQEEANNENYYGNEEDLRNEKFYENTEFGTSEEVLYDNKEVMYDNKAFVPEPEPEPDLYQNVEILHSSDQRSAL